MASTAVAAGIAATARQRRARQCIVLTRIRFLWGKIHLPSPLAEPEGFFFAF